MEVYKTGFSLFKYEFNKLIYPNLFRLKKHIITTFQTTSFVTFQY